MFHTSDSPEPEFTDIVEIDLGEIEASVAGPKRPQDRIFIRNLHDTFESSLSATPGPQGFGVAKEDLKITADAGDTGTLTHGSIVIAAITSCTNTSNPTLMLGAGIVAKKALELGLTVPAYVKTSFAPGSRVVTEYLRRAKLLAPLEALGFHVVAYGCTTCIGNSGPLRPEIEAAIKESRIVAASALSGNRNFEGRIHPLTQANYLCSPPLVVAFALKGTVHVNLYEEPIGQDQKGNDVYLKDIWPTREEIADVLQTAIDPTIYQSMYGDVTGDPIWKDLGSGDGSVYEWVDTSTYIREPTFFDGLTVDIPATSNIDNAHVLGYYGDFITTDHISPAGAIPLDSAAADYLRTHGVNTRDFNSFGSRRGNHEVMIRGTFANIRIRNKLSDKLGGYTTHHPTGEQVSIYEASDRYRKMNTPLVVLAGKLYGAGSSRDWAAKGTFLLGVKAVIAESFERIHRSNLVEMGVLPLEFLNGQTAESLGLTGKELFTISDIAEDLIPRKILPVVAVDTDGSTTKFDVLCRIDSAIEVEYYQHGGILQYVLRDVLTDGKAVLS